VAEVIGSEEQESQHTNSENDGCDDSGARHTPPTAATSATAATGRADYNRDGPPPFGAVQG